MVTHLNWGARGLGAGSPRKITTLLADSETTESKSIVAYRVQIAVDSYAYNYMYVP